MTEQLWHQKFLTEGDAIDAMDVFIHTIGRRQVISESIYQSQKDELWVAACRYNEER